MRFSASACTVLTTATATASVVAAVVHGETTTSSSTTTGDNSFVSRSSTIWNFHHQSQHQHDQHQTQRSLKNVAADARRSRKERLLASSIFRQHHPTSSTWNNNKYNNGLLRNVVPSSSSSHGADASMDNKSLTQCDPQQQKQQQDQSLSSLDADVGVLSCGLGQYCAISSDSPLGGYCVQQQEHEQTTTTTTTRALQSNNNNMILNDIVNFCQGTTAMGQRFVGAGALTCETCSIDAARYTGNVNCTYEESCYELGGLCPEDTETTEFCESTTIEANLTGPDEYSYRVCYNLHEPKNWTYCVTYEAVPDKDTTCEINVDGTICNSCTVRGNNCKEFDCENTMLRTSSSSCGYSLMESFTSGILYEQLPCENGCNLCPDDGYMASPENIFISSSGVATNCFVAQLSAMTGEYSRNQCSRESARIDNCDCEEQPPTAAPTPSAGDRSFSVNPVMAAAMSIAATSALGLVGVSGDFF